MRALATAVLMGALLPGTLLAQSSVFTSLGQGLYPEAGLVAVDEVTAAAQTVGADGLRNTFDDAVAILRDVGGIWTVVTIPVGPMTPGLIAVDDGVIATVTSGIDGQVGTADDAVILVENCSTGTAAKVHVPLPGNFVGGAALVEDVVTRDLLGRVGPHLLAVNLDGVSSGSTGGDVALLLDVSVRPPVPSQVSTGTLLHRSPPVSLARLGDPALVLGIHGRGEDTHASSMDDVFVVLNRNGQGAWQVRSAPVGAGLVDGFHRRPRRLGARHAVGLAVSLETEVLLGYSPSSFLAPPLRAGIHLFHVDGVDDASKPLSVGLELATSVDRWIPHSPAVCVDSAWMFARSADEYHLLEFNQFGSGGASVIPHPWTAGLSHGAVLSFYGTNVPVARAGLGAIGTTDPQVSQLGGWQLFSEGTGVSQVLVVNDGLLVQACEDRLGFVENLTGGAFAYTEYGPPVPMFAESLVALGGGGVAVLGAGYDGITGTADDGILTWTRLPGVTVLGHGHPSRPDGGPKVRVDSMLYPASSSSIPFTVYRSQAGSAALGTWRPGFLVFSPNPGFEQLSWGRSFIDTTLFWQIGMLDPFAGVGSTGEGVTFLALPGDPSLWGQSVVVQWIVRNDQSPWLCDTSNGLLFHLGR